MVLAYAIAGARLHILRQVQVTVTPDGGVRQRRCYWGRYGAAGLFFRLRGRTAPPRCCYGTARWRETIGPGTWACRAVLETATGRRNRPPQSQVNEEAGLSAERLEVRATVVTAGCAGRRHALDLHHRCRRCQRIYGHRAQPGKRRTALGGRERVADLPLHPSSPPVGSRGPLRRPCHWRRATNGGSGCRAPFRSVGTSLVPGDICGSNALHQVGRIGFAAIAPTGAARPPRRSSAEVICSPHHHDPAKAPASSTAGSRCALMP